MGTSTGIMYKGGCPPPLSPQEGWTGSWGWGASGSCPTWSVPTRPLAEGAPEGMGLGVPPCRPLHARGGGGLCTRRGAWNVGAEAPATSPPHPWGLEGDGHQGTWLPGRVAALRALGPAARWGVGMSVWSGPAATAGEVPGCGCGAGTGHCFFSRVVMVTSCLAALAMS